MRAEAGRDFGVVRTSGQSIRFRACYWPRGRRQGRELADIQSIYRRVSLSAFVFVAEPGGRPIREKELWGRGLDYVLTRAVVAGSAPPGARREKGSGA